MIRFLFCGSVCSVIQEACYFPKKIGSQPLYSAPLILRPSSYHWIALDEDQGGELPDPTAVIIVDKVDSLQMNSLAQMRSIFDECKAGMVLIGMLGIEKRVARSPQFYPRISFVREFRALHSVVMQRLL